MDNDTIRGIQEKIAYFYNNNIDIHLFLLDGSWARGKIISIEGNHFILDERINGRTIVLFQEILSVQKLKRRGEDGRASQS